VKLFFQRSHGPKNPVDIGVDLIGFLKLMTLAQTEVDFMGIPETGHETRREILELLRHRYQQNRSPKPANLICFLTKKKQEIGFCWVKMMPEMRTRRSTCDELGSLVLEFLVLEAIDEDL